EFIEALPPIFFGAEFLKEKVLSRFTQTPELEHPLKLFAWVRKKCGLDAFKEKPYLRVTCCYMSFPGEFKFLFESRRKRTSGLAPSSPEETDEEIAHFDVRVDLFLWTNEARNRVFPSQELNRAAKLTTQNTIEFIGHFSRHPAFCNQIAR